jgi:long-chain acyl-CoA synthetase
VQRDTLIAVFRDLVEIRGEFLVYDDGYRRRSHTYADVGRAARGFAARLSAAGLAKGDTVIFWGENRPEWIACYWGCLLNGIVVVPIDYRASAEFLLKVTGIVDAKAVLVGDAVDAGTIAAGRPIWSLAEVFRISSLKAGAACNSSPGSQLLSLGGVCHSRSERLFWGN